MVLSDVGNVKLVCPLKLCHSWCLHHHTSYPWDETLNSPGVALNDKRPAKCRQVMSRNIQGIGVKHIQQRLSRPPSPLRPHLHWRILFQVQRIKGSEDQKVNVQYCSTRLWAGSLLRRSDRRRVFYISPRYRNICVFGKISEIIFGQLKNKSGLKLVQNFSLVFFYVVMKYGVFYVVKELRTSLN